MAPPRSPGAALKWADKNGVKLNSVDIVESHGLGLIPRSNQVVPFWIKVPGDLVVTATRVRNLATEDPGLRRWLHNVPDDAEIDTLHRFLLYQHCRSDKRHWPEYVTLLPTKVGLPFSWTPQNIEKLACTSLYEPTLARRLSIEKAHTRFVSHVADIPIETWLLAYEWIASRALAHPITGERCLVPIGDLCNHSFAPTARYDLAEDGHSFVWVPYHHHHHHHHHHHSEPDESTTDTNDDDDDDDSNKNNQELKIEIDYGERSSAALLFNYGFVPSEEDAIEDLLRKPVDPYDPDVRQAFKDGLAAGAFDAETRKLAMVNGYDMLIELLNRPLYQLKLGSDGKWECDLAIVMASFEHLEFNDEDKLCIGSTLVGNEEGAAKAALSPEIAAEIEPVALSLVQQLATMYLARIRDNLPDLTGEVRQLAENEARIYERFVPADLTAGVKLTIA